MGDKSSSSLWDYCSFFFLFSLCRGSIAWVLQPSYHFGCSVKYFFVLSFRLVLEFSFRLVSIFDYLYSGFV